MTNATVRELAALSDEVDNCFTHLEKQVPPQMNPGACNPYEMGRRATLEKLCECSRAIRELLEPWADKVRWYTAPRDEYSLDVRNAARWVMDLYAIACRYGGDSVDVECAWSTSACFGIGFRYRAPHRRNHGLATPEPGDILIRLDDIQRDSELSTNIQESFDDVCDVVHEMFDSEWRP